MLRYVVLPQIGPSIAAASIFAFAWSFNNFEISFFTGGFEQTFPVWVFSILRQSENLPVVNAVSTVIAAAQILAVFGGWALMKRLSKSDDDERPDRPADRGHALMEVRVDPGPPQLPREAPRPAARLPRHARRRSCSRSSWRRCWSCSASPSIAGCSTAAPGST